MVQPHDPYHHSQPQTITVNPPLLVRCLLTLALASGSFAPLAAEDWPQWRGPRNDGTSLASGVPTRWSAEENIRWRAAMPGQGGATPIVWQDRLFVSSADGDDQLGGQLTGSNDSVRWHLPTTPDVALPLVVDRNVYLLHNDGRLLCVDLASGKQHFFDRTHTSQHRASPLYAAGHIYLCGRDGVCTVVKAADELQVVASNDLGEPITASPIVAHGTLYLRSYDAVYAIGAAAQ